jgi:hypothetical protein
VWVIEIDFFSLSVDLYWFMKILGVLMGRRTFRASELHCRREVMGTFQMADGSHREKKFDIDIVTQANGTAQDPQIHLPVTSHHSRTAAMSARHSTVAVTRIKKVRIIRVVIGHPRRYTLLWKFHPLL